ncbi:MAG TPA: hypothetical protein V6C57_19695 [Coleofasciculaceae cyanobacterium]
MPHPIGYFVDGIVATSLEQQYGSHLEGISKEHKWQMVAILAQSQAGWHVTSARYALDLERELPRPIAAALDAMADEPASHTLGLCAALLEQLR